MQDTIENLEGEIWKDIPGYEGKYMVSNMGRFMNTTTKYILKNILDAYGYYYVDLRNKNMKSHRGVAIAFIPNPDNKPQVNHIDGNPTNNTITNLEWVTNKENQLHSFKYLGRRSGMLGKTGYKNKTGKKVIQMDKDDSIITIWGSVKDAERNTGICNQNIFKVCFGKRKTAGGYKWKFGDAEGLTRIGQSDEYVLGDDGIYIPYVK